MLGLPKPDACSDELYALMRKCWLYETGERCTFEEIYEFFKRQAFALTRASSKVQIVPINADGFYVGK